MNKIIFLMIVSSFLGLSTVQGVLNPADYGPKIAELVQALHSTCVSKTGIDEASIGKVMHGEFTDDPKMKAYMACLLVEGGAIDDNGEWNMDMAGEMLPAKIKEASLANIKTCNTKTKDIANLNDKVFTFMKCTYDLNPDIFIFF